MLLATSATSNDKDAAQRAQPRGLDPIRIADRRHETITQLIRDLRHAQSTNEQIRLCYALGELRADSALTELTKRLRLEDKNYTGRVRSRPRWGRYPAQEALVKIGVGATPKMIGKLKLSGDEQERELAVGVLKSVYGPKIAKAVIADAAENEKNPERRRRLLDAGMKPVVAQRN
jgi:hypothetical protein